MKLVHVIKQKFYMNIIRIKSCSSCVWSHIFLDANKKSRFAQLSHEYLTYQIQHKRGTFAPSVGPALERVVVRVEVQVHLRRELVDPEELVQVRDRF